MRINLSALLTLPIGLALTLLCGDYGPWRRDTLATSAEVRVLSAVGMWQVVLDLGPKFERATGQRLKVFFDSGAVIVKRLEGGETADVVVIPRAGIDRLASVIKAKGMEPAIR